MPRISLRISKGESEGRGAYSFPYKISRYWWQGSGPWMGWTVRGIGFALFGRYISLNLWRKDNE